MKKAQVGDCRLRIAGLGFAILGRQKPPRARRAREGWNHEGHEEHEGEGGRTNRMDRMDGFWVLDWEGAVERPASFIPGV